MRVSPLRILGESILGERINSAPTSGERTRGAIKAIKILQKSYLETDSYKDLELESSELQD